MSTRPGPKPSTPAEAVAVASAEAGAEIAARIMEEAFYALAAPVWRLGAVDAPIPQDPELEELCVPQVEGIADAIRALVGCGQSGDAN